MIPLALLASAVILGIGYGLMTLGVRHRQAELFFAGAGLMTASGISAVCRLATDVSIFG